MAHVAIRGLLSATDGVSLLFVVAVLGCVGATHRRRRSVHHRSAVEGALSQHCCAVVTVQQGGSSAGSSYLCTADTVLSQKKKAWISGFVNKASGV